MKNLPLLIFLTVYSFLTYSQTLIMNEVSQGVTGNMEYVEFVVVDNTATYDCASGQPPTIDIRGWIFDDNSGYHGAGGIAAGCIRFSFDPLWSAVPMGTIILIYNDGTPDPSIPATDISLADGNCTIVAPISDVNLFESNSTTPGAVACSYPAAGWTPGGNWSNVLLANTGDCARIVNLAGCEVFSVCYSSCNVNTLIYFANGAEGGADHRNTVYYFTDGDPNTQVNWSIGCTDNELVLDANQCGSNEQTPGAPNNALNAAFIAQFNNGCTPIPPLVANAMIDNHEICGCDGSATVTPSGSIPGYTYEWFDASMTPIGQTGITATSLCAGNYYVEITSSIGCQEIASVTVNPGSGIPSVTSVNGGASYCSSDPISNITATVTGTGPWDVTYTIDGGSTQTASGAPSPIILGNTPGVYVVTGVTDANCSNTASGTQTITILPDNTITPASSNPIGCINTAIPNVTFTTTGATGIGAATGLPAGVTASFVGNTITVSGTPTASGTFNYSIPLTGGCGTVTATGTITVNAQNTIAAGTSPTLCINTAMTAITLATTGATGATFSGLPTGVTGSWSGNVATISGTPTVAGPFAYTVTTTGGCPPAATTGTITVTPNNTVSASSSDPIVCINTAIPSVTFTTTGATGIGAAVNLPAGVTASFAGNTITVTGTPSASGTFNYSIPLTGGCGTVNASGTITVNAQNTIATGTSPTLCINTAMTAITLATTGATGATFSGLPAGVSGTWSADVVTISGTPTASGTFNYTVTTTGGCPPATAAGTIDVNPAPVIGATGINPSSCAALDGSIDMTYTSGSGSTGLVSWTGPTSGSLGPGILQ